MSGRKLLDNLLNSDDTDFDPDFHPLDNDNMHLENGSNREKKRLIRLPWKLKMLHVRIIH
ncbi:hypothetical protein PR048_027467 [Dryococelus australis]|uniref:Uncharacterized protein n=1 Tax=Dryococelus australis TaxID=614101 RepID=A0ABQ9GFI9_9NEOP|nr:hypothetical protein PR048_027467 [Dryococelus australis]